MKLAKKQLLKLPWFCNNSWAVTASRAAVSVVSAVSKATTPLRLHAVSTVGVVFRTAASTVAAPNFRAVAALAVVSTATVALIAASVVTAAGLPQQHCLVLLLLVLQ